MLHPYFEQLLAKERADRLKNDFQNGGPPWGWALLVILIIFLCIFGIDSAFASIPRLPGSDQSDKLQAAGSLLRMVDSLIFSWGARIFAGLLILNAGLSLKNQAFGLAFISVIGAIVVGTAPMWVKNIFDIGGGTLFSMASSLGGFYA